MSPRLPRILWSARRMTFISGLLRRFHGGIVACDGVVDLFGGLRRRGRIAATALTIARRTARPRVGDALGVRQQCHLARVLDRIGDVALLLHGVAGDPTVANLGTVAHEAGQQVDVFVVDVLDLVGDKDAGLLLELLWIDLFWRSRLVLLARHLLFRLS